MSQQLVHLVYIHGFRGDETTFQAFPTHLQQYVTEHIPSHLNLRVQSSLYPTYKSVKPISSATKNFIEWLRTQPPGPVILLAHSMGGLLAAEAATDPSSANDGRRRIVGLIAFDCPYLGMHPHVVITGLASLVPKKNESKMKTEAELNPDPEVRIVDRTKETENWNEKQNVYSSAPSPSNSSTLSSAASHSESDHFVGRAMKLISSHSDDALVRWARKHSNEPFSAGKRWVVEHFQFGSCMFDPSGLKDRYTNLVLSSNLLWVNYWTVTAPKSHQNVSHNLYKEADSQQMLDDNDEALIGTGVANPPENPSNTVAHIGLTASHLLPLSLDNTPETPVIPGPKTKSEVKAHAKATEKEIRAQQKERKKEEKHLEKKQKAAQKERHTHAKAATKARTEEKAGRHFVVLPTGLGAILGGGDHWERVVIGGVDDEVAAHCGLFIPEQNLEYTKLVERVGLRIMEWCDKV